MDKWKGSFSRCYTFVLIVFIKNDYNSDFLIQKRQWKEIILPYLTTFFTVLILIYFILQLVVYVSVFFIRSVSRGEEKPCNYHCSTSSKCRFLRLYLTLHLRLSGGRSSTNFKSIQNNPHVCSIWYPCTRFVTTWENGLCLIHLYPLVLRGLQQMIFKVNWIKMAFFISTSIRNALCSQIPPKWK